MGRHERPEGRRNRPGVLAHTSRELADLCVASQRWTVTCVEQAHMLPQRRKACQWHTNEVPVDALLCWQLQLSRLPEWRSSSHAHI